VAAAEKLAFLRIFEDEQGKMNRGPVEAGAQFLVVSQFTLAASIERGRRPSFDRALPGDSARLLVERLVSELRLRGFQVATGAFGAQMEVELVNDGPVTFVIDA
jgi:D-tyrosyl-tRNA(Tyr) deacylase